MPPVKCPSCHGSGREGHGENCGCCGGMGVIPEAHKRWLDLRAGNIPLRTLTDDELLENIPSRPHDRWKYDRHVLEIKRRLQERKTSFTF